MNKIVREHYPVANLPEDLLEGFEIGSTVRVVLEVVERPNGVTVPLDASLPREPLQAADLMEIRRQLLADGRPLVSTEEAVARIRELRDEWDN